jgi:LPXTG-motif cell wall-anchored protein
LSGRRRGREVGDEITYPLFWLFALLVAGGMLFWFRRRGWF